MEIEAVWRWEKREKRKLKCQPCLHAAKKGRNLIESAFTMFVDLDSSRFNLRVDLLVTDDGSEEFRSFLSFRVYLFTHSLNCKVQITPVASLFAFNWMRLSDLCCLFDHKTHCWCTSLNHRSFVWDVYSLSGTLVITFAEKQWQMWKPVISSAISLNSCLTFLSNSIYFYDRF